MSRTFAKFTEIMGECCTKEWIAKLPNCGDDEGNEYWVLIQSTALGEYCAELEGEFNVAVFASYNNIDWVNDPPHPLELLVEQFFTHQRHEWQASGPDVLELLTRARRYVNTI